MERIGVPSQIREALIAHADYCHPEEACGLLAIDEEGRLRMAYPTTNVERSRVRFTVSPREHYGAIKHAERSGWSIGGSFHSHPDSAAFPSARDVEGALDPAWLYVVVGMGNGYPEIRAFRIREYAVDEVMLVEEP